ncbi:hypothetical protein KIW84_012571 [Lathyrus oleraceus]|uniref:Uncharacterized protein n=1 Tax=Pisum sativum TaxID=3888 RepID=A0A9D5BI28_PEA|nr:hypothetical protein KIW84_012571 [Pisum sativum]
MCVRLLAAKSNWNVPDQCLEFFAKMILDATPTKDNLPTSFYDAKKLVTKLGLEVRKIDCCISDCMLFYDNEFGTSDGALKECKFCKSQRYQIRSKAINRVTDGGEDDFYDFVKHIYELVHDYLDSENKFVLFYYDWYDPSSRGTCYYVPYPSIVPRKRGWCVVIKTKPFGHIETDNLVEDVAYQVDEVEQINDVISVEQITSLSDTMVEGHQVDAFILLVENNMDEEHEELGSKDNITSDDENDMDEEHEDFEYFFL